MSKIDVRKLSNGDYQSITPLPSNDPKQAGPNCGLYALSYVMRHWYEKLKNQPNAIAQPLPARKVDVEGAVKLAANDPNKATSLRYLAKTANTVHPMTFLGELFSGDSLATVARKAGFQAKILKPDTKDYLPTLFRLIDANHPAIVSLDVDQDIHTSSSGGKTVGPNNGCPGQFGGEHAHWATIVAYEKGWFWDDVVMFHWEAYFQFAASQLRDSSGQLVRFSGQTWFKAKDPASQLVYNAKGDPVMFYDTKQPKDPLTGKYPVVAARTARGAHWQKLESASVPRNTASAGAVAWKTAGDEPGAYAQHFNTAPPLLTNKINGQVVQTVFGNTNLNLRNVIVEVVPQGIGFAKVTG